MYNLDLINYAIASACILHNLILTEEGDCDDYLDEIEDENDIENVAIEDENDQGNEAIRNIIDSGYEKRNNIAEML